MGTSSICRARCSIRAARVQRAAWALGASGPGRSCERLSERYPAPTDCPRSSETVEISGPRSGRLHTAVGRRGPRRRAKVVQHAPLAVGSLDQDVGLSVVLACRGRGPLRDESPRVGHGYARERARASGGDEHEHEEGDEDVRFAGARSRRRPRPVGTPIQSRAAPREPARTRQQMTQGAAPATMVGCSQPSTTHPTRPAEFRSRCCGLQDRTSASS